ncbi:tol-pal system protein YbgF [Fontimonas thermophila]|uniref:Cell division coordinator CpoB n=1 Tax=Fontimonas thermophila TaxID=1076937 RepID=A0A1I2HQ07_9GAMM|nr:tol-pal system protein YbgF [Fontimonas thermophila]SFF32194.1 tol-pal system protein YbgF [Fontimonas thermophila]
MQWWRVTAVGCAGAVLAGCASSFGGPIAGGSDNLSPTERRLQAVESRVAELSRRLDAVNLTGMDQENIRLRDDLRQIRGEMERLRFDFDQAQRRSREQYLDLDRRLQRLENPGAATGAVVGARVEPSGTITTTTPAPGTAAPLPPAADGGAPPPVTISSGSGASPEEEGAYLTAFDALKNGKYDEAIRGFRALLEKWPQGRYADNALYWSGEAYYVKRDYKSALLAFQAVLQRFPNSPKAPDAMLKTGLVQLDLKQEAEGRATLKRLVETYPQSNAAKLAQQRLGAN